MAALPQHANTPVQAASNSEHATYTRRDPITGLPMIQCACGASSPPRTDEQSRRAWTVGHLNNAVARTDWWAA